MQRFCLLAVLTVYCLSVALFGVFCLNSDVLSLLKYSSEHLLEITENILIYDSTVPMILLSFCCILLYLLFIRETICCVVFLYEAVLTTRLRSGKSMLLLSKNGVRQLPKAAGI